MKYMLLSTEKYNFFFNPEIPGIWALPIPGFGTEKNVRDPGLQSLLDDMIVDSIRLQSSKTKIIRNHGVCHTLAWPA